MGFSLMWLSQTPHLPLLGVVDSLGSQGFSVSAQLNPGRITVLVFTLSEGILLESTEIGALLYDVKPVQSKLVRGESIPNIQVSPHQIVVGDTSIALVVVQKRQGTYEIGIRGDSDHDGSIDILDVISSVRTILGKIPAPDNASFDFARLDANKNGAINVADVVHLISELGTGF